MDAETEIVTVICKTEGCLNKDIPIEVAIPLNLPSAGVYCGGGCGNRVHSGNDLEALPEPTIEDQIDERLRQLGLIN